MSDDGERGVTGKGAVRRPIRLMEVIGNAIVGGMETYTRNLIASLDPDEYDITCILPYESAYTASLRDLGCRVYVTPIVDDPPWRSIELLNELVKLHRIDVIHANLANATTLAGVVGRMTGTPTVATLHSRTLWIQELSVAKVTGLNLITVCQEAFGQALACGIPPECLSLIPNGVDTTRFSPANSGEAFRSSLGLGPETPLVGFVGRLSWEKGPDKFVHAAGRIGAQRPDVHFAMVGEGPVEPDLHQLIDHLGMGGRFHMVGMRRDVETIYPAFDVLIQTSRSEAMPLALLEGMASGVPVVAFSVGGVAELIECGTTGCLVTPVERPGALSAYPPDWEGIAVAALDILSRPERLKQMGVAARQRATAHFDLAQSVRDTSKVFHTLARASRAKGVWQPTVVREASDEAKAESQPISGGRGRSKNPVAAALEESARALAALRSAEGA